MYSSADQASPLDEEVLSNIESTWAPASKQFPLLNMGKEVKVVTAIYDNRKFKKKIKKLYCERRRNVGNGITSYAIFFLIVGSL